MPSRYNGIGTRFIGARQPASDGSYVTTKFFVVGFFPILPLGSFRVRPTGIKTSGRFSGGGSYSNTEFDAARVGLCWRQVLAVYAVELAFIVAIVGAVYGIGKL